MKQQRLHKRIWQGMLLALFLLGIGLFAGDIESLAAAPAGTEQGVAVVAEYGRRKASKTYSWLSYGSCFFVGNPGEDPQYLVTNYHVIAAYDQYGGGEKISVFDTAGVEYDKLVLRVYFDKDDYVEAYPKEVNPKMDVAVLYLEHPTNKRKALPIRVPTEEDKGNTVYAYGFPGIGDDKDAVDPVSQFGINDVSVTSGVVERLVTESGTGVRQIQTGADFWHGNSGGPLVDENGVVLGITTSGTKFTTIDYTKMSIDVEEMKYAVSCAEVIPLLDRNNIPHTESGSAVGGDVTPDPNATSDPNADTGSGSNTTLIIIICAVAGVVVIFVIILIIVLSKKKKKAPAPAQPQGRPTPPSAQPMGGQAQPGVQAADRNISVQATSGMLAGRTFTAGPDGRITFGRQPACQVVFGSNDKNVSGNHCVVYKQNGNIVLMDTGSTNGTFLENGTKLQPNIAYPMRSGDRFYLVNTNYMFTVR